MVAMLRTRSLCLFTIAALAVAILPAEALALRAPVARALVPLRAIEKTGGRISADGLTSTVVVKYREGTAKHAAAPAEAEIAAAAVPGGVRPTFDRPAGVLREEEARLEAASGVDLADLSLYVDVLTASPRDAERLAQRLERLDTVEFAYVRPEPVAPSILTATAPAGPSTPDFTHLQYYLGRAPAGFGIEPVRELAGGRGEGVRIVDIEYSWNLGHEDLPFGEGNQPFLEQIGPDPFPEDKGNHGTAALGMLVAADNGFGVTGMVPDVAIGIVSPIDLGRNYRLAQAIDFAADALARDGARGDIIQIEQQARGVNGEIALLPPEWDPAVFDAIQRAVARGLVVVEPAGNGGINRRGRPAGISLDRAELGGRFNRERGDSGAIMVGGGWPVDASVVPTSNYGPRVDVQGYGIGVTTLGYGDLYGSSPLDYYTQGWSGTSAAVPCVTGVAAIVQAVLRANGLAPLDCLLLRAVLAGTGTPDGSVKRKQIGPRPDANAAARGVDDPAVPLMTGLKFVGKRDELIVDGVYFASAGAPPDLQNVVFINDQPVVAEPAAGYSGPNGTATRLVVRGVDHLLPIGEVSFVKVGTTAGPLSPPRVYFRKK
jgi:hypothetical protein